MKRILLLDDSPTIQRVVSLSFSTASGFDVRSANSPAAANEILGTFRPHVVVAYVRFMGEANPSFFVGLKKTLPNILLLAESNEDLSPFEKAGFKDFLRKPFHTEELKKNIERLLQNALRNPDTFEQNTDEGDTIAVLQPMVVSGDPVLTGQEDTASGDTAAQEKRQSTPVQPTKSSSQKDTVTREVEIPTHPIVGSERVVVPPPPPKRSIPPPPQASKPVLENIETPPPPPAVASPARGKQVSAKPVSAPLPPPSSPPGLSARFRNAAEGAAKMMAPPLPQQRPPVTLDTSALEKMYRKTVSDQLRKTPVAAEREVASRIEDVTSETSFMHRTAGAERSRLAESLAEAEEIVRGEVEKFLNETVRRDVAEKVQLWIQRELPGLAKDVVRDEIKKLLDGL